MPGPPIQSSASTMARALANSAGMRATSLAAVEQASAGTWAGSTSSDSGEPSARLRRRLRARPGAPTAAVPGLAPLVVGVALSLRESALALRAGRGG